MKVGDLVRSRNTSLLVKYDCGEDWVGLIIGFSGSEAIVYWNERFPNELEYTTQLQVVTPRKNEII